MQTCSIVYFYKKRTKAGRTQAQRTKELGISQPLYSAPEWGPRTPHAGRS